MKMVWEEERAASASIKWEYVCTMNLMMKSDIQLFCQTHLLLLFLCSSPSSVFGFSFSLSHSSMLRSGNSMRWDCSWRIDNQSILCGNIVYHTRITCTRREIGSILGCASRYSTQSQLNTECTSLHCTIQIVQRHFSAARYVCATLSTNPFNAYLTRILIQLISKHGTMFTKWKKADETVSKTKTKNPKSK